MQKQKIFIGADVSKGYADFIVLTEDKKVAMANFQLDDTKDGHRILKKEIKKLNQIYHVLCGVENTGGYERNWVNLIKDMSTNSNDLEVYKFNPKAVKHQIQSLLKTNIDDAVSAKGIAMYLINNHELFKKNWERSMAEKEETTEGKMLHGFIQNLIKQRTMKKNQLEKLLYQSFPEILSFTKQGFPDWILNFLKRYPTAEATKRAKLKGITSIKHITLTKAQDIKQKAKNSVASQNGRIMEIMVSQMCIDIMSLNEEINQMKKELEILFIEDPNIQIIQSIKGIALWSAVSFLIELGDYKRFETTSQLVGFFGVNPAFKISGDGVFNVRMSKKGSPKMRATLFTIANNVVLHDPHFKYIYSNHRARGKKHKQAIGVIMQKVLKVLWGMLKNNTAYKASIDQENIIKYKQHNQCLQISRKARRKQELTINAPISRSNTKKRKAMLESLSLTMNENTRSSNHSQLQI